MRKRGTVERIALGNSSEVLAWLRKFEATHGRPLRVLHTGNIANNAYNNAKIMRRAGIDADVICPDYYHIMGCPEWEDADFSGDVGNADRPKWQEVDLKGFERPEWFVQGPRILAYKYLDARRSGKRWSASAYMFLLDWNLFGIRRTISRSISKDRWCVAFIPPVLVLSALIALRARLRIKSIVFAGKRYAPDWCYGTIRSVFRLFQRSLGEILNRRVYEILENGKQLSTSHHIDSRILVAHAYTAAHFANAARHYDFIIAYATEGVYPVLAGLHNFASYEHGTIRDIPFEDSDRGALCAFTYKLSPAVFITNTDCVAAADRLGIKRSRQYWIPHAFDTQKLAAFYEEFRPSIKVEKFPCEFIAPSRHHWSTGDASWCKGNDRIIRAAKLLHDQGVEFKIIFVEWGWEVDKSKALIEKLGVGSCIEWLPPMKKKQLWGVYLRSACIIDQFLVPAIGSVTFEAMALARPVITLLDDDVLMDFFGATPPVYNVSEPEGIAASMMEVINNSRSAEQKGAASQKWMSNYHSSNRIIDIQMQAFRDIFVQNICNSSDCYGD